MEASSSKQCYLFSPIAPLVLPLPMPPPPQEKKIKKKKKTHKTKQKTNNYNETLRNSEKCNPENNRQQSRKSNFFLREREREREKEREREGGGAGLLFSVDEIPGLC